MYYHRSMFYKCTLLVVKNFEFRANYYALTIISKVNFYFTIKQVP